MPVNRVSATLSQPDKDAILAALQTIKQKLPFLVDLTVDEKKSLPKLGDKSRAFVDKALELAVKNPGFLPRDFDIEEFKRDVAIFDALYSIQQSITILAEKVDDTYVAAGSEAYAAALVVYNYAKGSDIGTQGLDEVVDELGKRFARKIKSQKAA